MTNYRLLPVILILSLMLNLWGSYRWGTPKYWNPDEITGHATAMVAYWGFKPAFFHYGALPYYMVAAGAVVPVLAYSWAFDPPPTDLGGAAGTSWKERQKARIIPLARGISALMATVIVCLTFIIGMTLFNIGVGYIAAFLLTVSASFVGIAHVATVDGAANFWYWASCFFAVLFWKRGDRRWYILAALTAGFAIGSKIDRIVVLLPLILSYLFLRRDRREMRDLLLLAIFIAAGFMVANPTLLMSPFEFLDGFTRDFFFNALRGETGQTSYIKLLNYLRDGLGLPLLVTAVASLAYAVYKPPDKHAAAIVWLFATWLPYYITIGSLSQIFPRYVILGFPALMIVTAYGCSAVINGLSQRYSFAAKVMLGGIIGYSFLYTVELVLQFRNDPRYQATEWIERHAPANATIEVLRDRGPVISQEKYRIVDALQDREYNDRVWRVRDKLARHRLYQRIRQTIIGAEKWVGLIFGLPVRKSPYRAWFDNFVASYERPPTPPPVSHSIGIRQADYVLLIEDLQQKTVDDLNSPDFGYVRVAQFQSPKRFIVQPPVSIQYDLTLLVHRRVYVFQRQTSAP